MTPARRSCGQAVSSHNGLTGCGTAGDWASHQIEHELGGMFDVAHGAGLAAVWGSWARYVYQEEPEKFAHFAIHVMGVPADSGTAEETALSGIRAMENFFRSINMPVSLSELAYIPQMTRSVRWHRNVSFSGIAR